MRHDMLKVRGFARVQIVDPKSKKIVGDSGWQRNVVVNLGFQDYICGALGAIAGSKQVSYMAIGTGTKPAATADSLDGETGARVTTSNSVVSSKTLQATCQFAGTDMAGTCTIQNVALVNTSSGGTILCGTTYATSQWASNQNVNATSKAGGVELAVRLIKKLREFGGYLGLEFKTIPSRAVKILTEGVSTMYGALERVEDIVRTLWRHREQSRNAFALA